MTIYLDVIFLENLCMNYIILFTTGLINKIKIKNLRIVISSTVGSLYAILAYMQILKQYSSIILKIILSIVMVYIAFNPKNVKKIFKLIIIFYLVSFCFGGCALSMLYFIKPEEIFIKNGVLIGTYPIKIALLGGIVGFSIIITAFKIIKNKITKKDMFCNIEIYLKEKVQKTIAILDTGNFLKDPISQMPVIIVQKDALENILPNEILENIDKIIGGDFNSFIDNTEINQYISKFRLIPFSSLGKQHGILLSFRPDNVKIIFDENESNFKNVLIGIYDKELSKNKRYKALIGIEMLGEENINNEYFENIKV